MSRLTPDVIVLDKGLDLQTAKIVAPKGSVLDSLNYEQVDFQGQKRIDGFTRFDGSKLATFDDYYVLEFDAESTPDVGDLLSTSSGLFAVVVDFSNFGGTAVVIINEKLVPIVGDSVYVTDRNDGTLGDALPVTSINTGVDWEEGDVDLHYENLLAYQKTLRMEVEALPGPIAGLHWFRDRLYAVADVVAISLDGVTPTIYPNDVLDNGFEEAKVLDAFTLSDTRLVFIDSFDAESLWQEESRDIERNGSSVGTIASGFNYFTSEAELASFFEARSEQQVLEEADDFQFGWRFKDLGWKVNYVDGSSLYGSLPSLNQNISGLGIQGPTDTSGNNGKPTVLTQNVVIEGKSVQVEGWKSSQSPTIYTLDIDNISAVDDVTIYADAYISWDGITGNVSAPGVTTATLDARSADSTVDYTGTESP